MPTTRRDFMAISGLASAGLMLPSGASAKLPAGAKQPAPRAPPSSASDALIKSSRLTADEPLAKLAVEAAVAAGASYADARLVSWRRENIEVRERRVNKLDRGDEYGIGIRVVAGGGWGFAATHVLTKDAVAAAAKRATTTAKQSGAARKSLGAPPVTLVKAPPAVGTWVAPHEVDPFSVSAKDKVSLLLDATGKALAESGVPYARASVLSVAEEKLMVSSEGSRTHQIFFRLLPSLSATAIDRRRGRFAKRNFEAAPMLGGWEYITGLRLKRAAAQVADDAKQKLHAKSVKPGPRKVILAPSNLWLTIHESIGHPTELDRAMGLEANYAGTSFIKPDDAGKLTIGSKRVNLIADRTQPGGLATTGWDDEGVAALRWDIVRNGKFVGWQTTRDQAAWIGESASRGCSYGQGYKGIAFQRMPNISLQPGAEGYATEDLINATEDGILISGRGSWSIDHQRYNFQFSGQMFWEVKRGRISRPLRDVAYQANTVEFWKSCDMLGGKGTYRLGGSFGDGKGQPSQSNAVSHGCPPARFKVNIVNTGGDR